MYFIYAVVLRLYHFLIFSASAFHWKAKKFIRERRGWKNYLKARLKEDCPKIWIYSPSIGEFQECRKFIKRLHEKKKNYQFIYTFFSPSGFDQAVLPGENTIRLMLPLDIKKNARVFLDLVKPESMYVLASGIWPNYISELQKRSIPHYMVSFHSRAGSPFYKPLLKSFYKPLFLSFEAIFCYNEEGKRLLKKHFDYDRAFPAGNLRFDCVIDMKQSIRTIKGIKEFVDGKFCIVAGSTEKEEDLILAKVIKILKHLDIKWIIVPHEKLKKTLSRLGALIGEDTCFYSKNVNKKKKVLIYDITGDLFQLYNYADVCMVGRGFHRLEIHNMLEPPVFFKPVLIGPKHKKFIEPILFIKKNLAFEFNNEIELQNLIKELYYGNIIIEPDEIKSIFDEYSGGTEKIMASLY